MSVATKLLDLGARLVAAVLGAKDRKAAAKQVVAVEAFDAAARKIPVRKRPAIPPPAPSTRKR